MSGRPDQDAFAFVGAFVEELARAGVRHVSAAPGSRSTPLALTIAAHRGITLLMHLDERSAAFFALGAARATGFPAAVLCTSGTAAANFFPAVVEAQASGVPLLVFTADRPPELRDVGAAQTIDQSQLYGAHAKWFVEVPLPEATTGMLRYARVLAHRAVATAMSAPAGPVHLNFPFREPLVPAPVEVPVGLPEDDRLAWTGRPDGAPWVSVSLPTGIPDMDALERAVAALDAARRPVLVCGPQYDALVVDSLVELARVLRAPIVADPLSQLRWGAHDRACVIEAFDATMRLPALVESLAPDMVVRVGGTPTSRALLDYLSRHRAATHLMIHETRWPDPALTATHMLQGDAASAIAFLSSSVHKRRGKSAWLDSWTSADEAARRALHRFCASLDESFEGRALAEVVELLPDGATLWVSSSMPVRDLDTFGRGNGRRIRVLANRGANGIDGVVSSALGAASASDGPLVLVTGDIALYHDMNGLLAARRHGLKATVVLLNNDGGGIFSFLPQAGVSAHFETLFGTPHGLDFAAAALLYGAQYCRAGSWSGFRSAVEAGIAGRGGGLHIVEVRTERARNVELHRLAREAVATSIAGGGSG